MIKKLLIRIWHLIELGIKSWYDFTFRKRNLFRVPLIIVTTQLMAELPELAYSDYLDPLYQYVNQEFGKFFGMLSEVIGNFITGNYSVGFSWVSVSIKLILIILFSFLAKSKEGGGNISWKWFWNWKWNFLNNLTAYFTFNSTTVIHKESEFDCNDAWFEGINETFLLNRNKYIHALYVQTSLEKSLIDQIVNHKSILSDYIALLINCRGIVIKFDKELENLTRHDEEQLILNTKSNLFSSYQNIIESVSKICESLSGINSLPQTRNIRKIELEQIYFPISSSELNISINSNSFDLIKVKIRPSVNNKLEFRNQIFKAFSPILISLAKLNKNINELNKKKAEIQNSFIVHAAGGQGKTYFSSHIYHSLKEKGHFPLLIPGSAFSGNYSSISHAFRNIFQYSGDLSLRIFLSKLNKFGKKKNKRIVLIVDGINETSNILGGFSSIWKDGLESMVEIISEYDYLAFLVTCRTSYLENTIDPFSSLEGTYKLIGFEDFEIRKEAIQQYFNYYRIESNSITRTNSRLFSVPLILKIYCENKNGNREAKVSIKLNHNSHEQTIFEFVQAECIEIADKLDRPSSRPIYNAILRCSSEFIKEVSASLHHDTFLELSQGESIDNIFRANSIGLKFLESEHLFMKDFQPYFEGEKVVHTFQNVGGYMLAQFLYKKYNDPVDFVMSKDFTSFLSGAKKDRIKGFINSQCHQLVFDLMLFMVFQYSKNDAVDYSNDLIDYSQDPLILEYSWQFVVQFYGYQASTRLEKKLKSFLHNINVWDGLLERNIEEFLDKDSRFNFDYIKDLLLNTEPSLVELTWVKCIYERIEEFNDFLEVDFNKYDDSQKTYALEITIWLLETTSHNLRDKATQMLLEYGINEPNFILSKLEEYSRSGRLYIYERLAGIAYGVCLRRQNDQAFVESELRLFAETVYKLQFSSDPLSPSYHYIVIDSFKHIIDLAEHLNVFEVPEEDNERFGKYKFNPADVWQEVNDEEIKSVSLQWRSGPDPDPLSGDFVVYTIPRLLSSKEIDYSDAVAHIYKRLISKGYQADKHKEMPKGVDRDFYAGVKKYGMEGKVDRLGKKYSWNSFFEYAGHLLNLGKLNVFYDGSTDTGVTSYYQRLSDVRIEVSNPLKKEEVQEKLYTTNLLANKSNSEKWTEKEYFESLNEVYTHKFDDKEFTLLYGYFEEGKKRDHRYSLRSFLLVESFLVKKEEIQGKEEQVLGITLDWSKGIHIGGSLSKVYFGELYWADSIPDMKAYSETIPSTEMTEIDHYITPVGILKFDRDTTKKGKEMVPVQIPLTIEPTYVDYLWESDSEIYPSLSGNIPSPNIGKHLNLKADVRNFQIIDENKNRAFISVDYKEGEILKQNSDYIRTDLLKKYLDDKGLVLMYQIKQHTFDDNAGDGTGDFRGMQFKIHK